MLLLRYGWGRWTASQNVETLVEPMPGELELYWPRLAYLLIDEGRYTEEQLALLHNVAVALFRLENSCTPTDVQRVVAALAAWLSRHMRVCDKCSRSDCGACYYWCSSQRFLSQKCRFRGGVYYAGRTCAWVGAAKDLMILLSTALDDYDSTEPERSHGNK
jgi:hypothetical protein